MKKKKSVNLRRNIILIAAVLSVLLYMAGVFSGLFASKVIEEKTKSDIQLLKSQTSSDLRNLEKGTSQQITKLNEYINFLEENLNSIQLEQLFLQPLSHNQKCEFTGITMKHLERNLQYYREHLPVRLEKYEKENILTEEYKFLKQQYNSLSVRMWILTRNQHSVCESTILPGLYFYTAECENCVEQGRELDKFIQILSEEGINVVLFTVDANAKDTMVNFLKQYYRIQDVPAIIINEKVFQGKVYTSEELVGELS